MPRRRTASPRGIISRDLARAHRIANRLRAGTVWINCYNIFDAALPFGGETKSVCASLGLSRSRCRSGFSRDGSRLKALLQLDPD